MKRKDPFFATGPFFWLLSSSNHADHKSPDQSEEMSGDVDAGLHKCHDDTDDDDRKDDLPAFFRDERVLRDDHGDIEAEQSEDGPGRPDVTVGEGLDQIGDDIGEHAACKIKSEEFSLAEMFFKWRPE